MVVKNKRIAGPSVYLPDVGIKQMRGYSSSSTTPSTSKVEVSGGGAKAIKHTRSDDLIYFKSRKLSVLKLVHREQLSFSFFFFFHAWRVPLIFKPANGT